MKFKNPVQKLKCRKFIKKTDGISKMKMMANRAQRRALNRITKRLDKTWEYEIFRIPRSLTDWEIF